MPIIYRTEKQDSDSNLKPKRILIVDDEPNLVLLLGLFLEDAGYEILKAYDGTDAINVAIAEIPDLILIDFIMPHKNGVEVCRILKSNPITKHIPIIMVSCASDDIKLEAFASGISEFVRKPFSTEDLLEIVARYA